MTKVLAINLGWEQEPLLRRLGNLGLDVYGVHYDKNYYQGIDYKDILIADLRDLESLLKFAEKVQPEAVVADQCDYSHFAQACIAEIYGLSGPSLDSAQISSNKYIQRCRCKELGILVPEFKLCRSLEQVRSFANTNGFPLVLKAVDNRGSFGVNRVDSQSELVPAFFDSMANSHSRLVLAESFIGGNHLTVDGYAFPTSGCRSLSLASKLMIGGQRQVAVDILYPGEIDSKLYEKVCEINEEVCTKLGYKFGMTHCEYMLSENDEIYLIEAANRGGGVYTSEIICPTVSGVDVLTQYLSDVLGEEIDIFPDVVERNQVILKFFSFPPGVVESVSGTKGVLQNKGVLRFRLELKPGDEISPITTDANRHGFLIYEHPGDIRKEVEEILKMVEVTYVQNM